MPKFDETKQEEKLAALHRSEEENLMQMLSQKYGHQYANLNGVPINTEALKLIDEDVARDAEIAAFAKTAQKLSVAVRNPNSRKTQDVIAELQSREFSVITFMASRASLEHVWERYEDIRNATSNQKGIFDISAEKIEALSQKTKTIEDVATSVQSVSQAEDTQGISEILEVILGSALALGASDVHIEPEAEAIRLRFRLDGVLWDATDVERKTYELLRSRLKLLSGLKLNITDQAQDGRFTIDIQEKEMEIRSSAIPGAYGESIVMRILDPSTINLTVANLGINKHLLRVLNEEIKRPNGMILTTGPTGSGKTTTLYAFLRQVHKPEIKIITIEDPIEYHLEGIVQTQVSKDYSFATGLRSILRQDPDVIMVGEIRDSDVTETAINAALTGHLVFSTLHTNSAVGSFPRLIDLGANPRTMGSAINMALAQRLIRRLCTNCKKARAVTERELELITETLADYPEPVTVTKETQLYEAVGCEACAGSGYKGRIGIYEGIKVDAAIEEVIANNPSEDTIRKAAAPQKIPTMQQDGLIKLIEGTTSFEELARVVDLFGKTRPADEKET